MILGSLHGHSQLVASRAVKDWGKKSIGISASCSLQKVSTTGIYAKGSALTVTL